MSQNVENALKRLEMTSGLDEILELLRKLMPPPTISYIVIDGVDECDKSDRDKLLQTLLSLVLLGSNVRLFLSSRASLREEIQTWFSEFGQISMDCQAAHDDIAMYITSAIKANIQNGDLKVRDQNLVEEISQALVNGAHGM